MWNVLSTYHLEKLVLFYPLADPKRTRFDRPRPLSYLVTSFEDF
jgi:hypothetical protein